MLMRVPTIQGLPKRIFGLMLMYGRKSSIKCSFSKNKTQPGLLLF